MSTVDTKIKIIQALVEKVRYKDIDDITVQELTEACGISRQTFYYHFTDILDVVEYYAHLTVEKILSDCNKCNTPQEATKVIVACLCQDTVTTKKLFQSSFGYRLCDIFLAATRTIIENNLVKNIASYSVPLSDVALAAEFFANAVFGTCLRHGCENNFDVDDFSRKIDKLLKGSIKSLVGIN